MAEMATYYDVKVRVRDQHSSGVEGVKVTISAVGWGNKYTDSSGYVTFYDVPDEAFTYTATAPSGYTCDYCSGYYRITTSAVIGFTLIKDDEPNYDVHVNCKDQNSSNIQNVAISIDGSVSGYTNSSGNYSKSIIAGQHSIKGYKTGYSCDDGHTSCTEVIVLDDTYQVINFSFIEDEPFVCSQGDTRGYNSCPDGSHYYSERCNDNEWVPTGDSCPEPQTCIVDVNVTDQNNNTVAGVVININGAEGADDISTNMSGVAQGFTLISGRSYTRKIKSVPSGYTAVSGSSTFTAQDDQTFSMKVNKDDAICEIDFLVKDLDYNAISGVVCRIDGKSATTDSIGTCRINVTCGNTYTATCDIPEGYNCDAAPCICSDGPFTPPYPGGSVSFFLDKEDQICSEGDSRYYEHCKDGSLKPNEICVDNEWISNPDKCTEYANDMEITVPASANQFEEFDVDMIYLPGRDVSIYRYSLFLPDTAIGTGKTGLDCKARIKCKSNKAGDIELYGCYNPDFAVTKCEKESPKKTINIIEAELDYRIEAPETVNAGVVFPVDVYFTPNTLVTVVVKSFPTYTILGGGDTDSEGHISIGCVIHNTGMRTIWAQTAAGLSFDKSNELEISVVEGGGDEDENVIKLITPSIAMAGEIEVSGTVLVDETVMIMITQDWWGDWNDNVIGNVTAVDGKFKTTIDIDDFGFYTLYAKVDKYPTDWKSKKSSIIVLNTLSAVVIAVLLFLLYDKLTRRGK